MKMYKYMIAILLSGVIILTGCSDRREINNVAVVLATGIDKEDGKFRVTIEVAIPISMKESANQKPYYLDSNTGRSLEEAIQNIQNRTSRIFRFSHQSIIIIHENIAKDDITEVLDFVNRNQESRLSSQIYITKSNLKDIMNASSELDPTTSEHISTIGHMLGYAVTAREFLSAINSNRQDPIAPMIVSEKGKPSIQSYAVFHKNKMQFETDSNETLGISWLKRNGLKGKILTFQLQGKIISLRITDQNFKIESLVKGDIPEYRIQVKGKGTIREGEKIFFLMDESRVHQLEHQIENQIKVNIEDILKKNLKNHIDTFGFGNYARVFNNLKWEKKWKAQWDTMLPEIKTSIEVKFVLDQIGLNINSSGYKQ